MSLWVFGYGSILSRPGISFARRVRAKVCGFSRRFHQGSPDHRGTPEHLGRVATLVREPGASTIGQAFEVLDQNAESVLAELDRREQGGYVRLELDVALDEGTVSTTTWTALPDNPFWLGDAPLEAIADRIRSANGPSGTNLAYLLELDETLRNLGIDDAHVRALAALARAAR